MIAVVRLTGTSTIFLFRRLAVGGELPTTPPLLHNLPISVLF